MQVQLQLFQPHDDETYHCRLTTPNGHLLLDAVLHLGGPDVSQRILQKAASLSTLKKQSDAKVYSLISPTQTTSSEGNGCIFNVCVRILLPDATNLYDGMSRERESLFESFALVNTHSNRSSWSPRDFYDCVGANTTNGSGTTCLSLDQVKCQLYPFQQRAVGWLLRREGIEAGPKRDIRALPHGLVEIVDADGRRCLYSSFLRLMTTDSKLAADTTAELRGGILAEEMGLGKTVEMTALMCLNKPSAGFRAQEDESWSPATLIITPPSILQQWRNEIESLAPSLKVLTYSGLRSEAKTSTNKQLLSRLRNHDVVLTTYNVLASEIHHVTARERELRHVKKYQSRLSPLVQLFWWRVVLDEAQMIESGVSNAAKVAQLIPRQNAWAVSGTPVRKDIRDLFGLLTFLRCRPYQHSPQLCHQLFLHKEIFRDIFGALTLRHTKEQIRNEIRLPAQKRIVLTIPFTQIEEQHYTDLYQQMCASCGVDLHGAPLADDWNPESPDVIESMRNWLTRLRQTCLHPEVGGRNRRALGNGRGPLRTVGEVLGVMIEQNEVTMRGEERALHLSQIRRGQILEHARQSEEALQLWRSTLQELKAIVKECRRQVQVDPDRPAPDSDDWEVNEAVAANYGTFRQRLRHTLEMEHICIFFIANAYFQIKSNSTLTDPDSEKFRVLERMEEEAYESAKIIRKELKGRSAHDHCRRKGPLPILRQSPLAGGDA